MLLATLAVQTLTHQALGVPPVDITPQTQIEQVGTRTVPDQAEESATKKVAIASPEASPAPEFSKAQSQQDTPNVVVPTVASQATQTSNSRIAVSETEVTPAQASVETEKERSLPVLHSAALPSATDLAALQSNSAKDLQKVSTSEQSTTLLASRNAPISEESANSQPTSTVVAQATSGQSRAEVEQLQEELRELENLELESAFQASPALSINIPTGFGLDNNTGFVSATYQERTRYSGGVDDGGLGIGIGLGDARESVGVELSYTAASFGGSRDFGAGGFNAKVHRQLPGDVSVAAGWNGFLNIGGDNDFENSLYGVATKIIRTRENISSPFSRVAITAGVGNGQFRTEDSVADDRDNINVFGNIAVRVARPVSLIAEWSGQDLGVGVSIAPFKDFPLVITPAVRDIAGAGDGARFVLGTGLAFRF